MGSDCEKPATCISIPVNKDPYTNSSGHANLGAILAGKDPNYNVVEYKYMDPSGHGTFNNVHTEKGKQEKVGRSDESQDNARRQISAVAGV
jgi:hypothetical protein